MNPDDAGQKQPEDVSPESRRRVKRLLSGGHALREEERRRIISQLASEEREAIRQIARGTIEEDPAIRSAAIAALRMDDAEPEASLEALRSLISEGEPAVQVKALHAIPRERAELVLEDALRLVRSEEARADVALAAARVAAAAGGEDVVDDIRSLRERLLPLVGGNERSPSITSLDRLIARATGTAPEAPEAPKLDV